MCVDGKVVVVELGEQVADGPHEWWWWGAGDTGAFLVGAWLVLVSIVLNELLDCALYVGPFGNEPKDQQNLPTQEVCFGVNFFKGGLCGQDQVDRPPLRFRAQCLGYSTSELLQRSLCTGSDL